MDQQKLKDLARQGIATLKTTIEDLSRLKGFNLRSLAGIIVGSGMDWLLKLWRTQ